MSCMVRRTWVSWFEGVMWRRKRRDIKMWQRRTAARVKASRRTGERRWLWKGVEGVLGMIIVDWPRTGKVIQSRKRGMDVGQRMSDCRCDVGRKPRWRVGWAILMMIGLPCSLRGELSLRQDKPRRKCWGVLVA